MSDLLKTLAERAHFNIYFSDLWQGTAQRFVRFVLQHVIDRLQNSQNTQDPDSQWGQAYNQGLEDAIKIIRADFGM